MCTHRFFYFLESQSQALHGSDEQNHVNKQMLNDLVGPTAYLISIFLLRAAVSLCSAEQVC